MKVVVSAVAGMLDPRVVPALEREGYRVTLRWCTHPGDYPRALREALLSGEDVAVVEHDVEAPPGALVGFSTCLRPWCFHAYDFPASFEETVTEGNGMPPHRYAPLGLARFRSGIGERVRGLLESEEWTADWKGRDLLLSEAFADVGLVPHRHHPKAIHHHVYPA